MEHILSVDTSQRLYQVNHAILPDELDATILAKKESAWNTRTGPRVGDFVLIGERWGRLSHDWGDELQWSQGGSFYLGHGGVSFSGSLNPGIPKANLTHLDTTKLGEFWFFHNDSAGASRAVGCKILCRVFRAKTYFYIVTTEGTPREIEAVDRADAWSEGIRLERAAQRRGDMWYPKTEVKGPFVKVETP